MNESVMIIEDVPEMSELMKLYLNNAGYDTKICPTAEEALEELEKKNKPKLILLDLNLPGISGIDFLKKLRNEYDPSIPVIVVSAMDADEDIIIALNHGADEFVTKPFSPKVLVARVNSKLARISETSQKNENHIIFGPYKLYSDSCILKKGEERIALSNKEYDILWCLIRNEGRTMPPEEIYNEVWRTKYGDITAVAVYIQRLRKKIEENPASPKFIITQYTKGYKFVR